jgi:hypothetical protein
VMLPPQQGRDDSLRARLAQGREANLPKPINAWGTGRDDAIKSNGNDSTFPSTIFCRVWLSSSEPPRRIVT